MVKLCFGQRFAPDVITIKFLNILDGYSHPPRAPQYGQLSLDIIHSEPIFKTSALDKILDLSYRNLRKESLKCTSHIMTFIICRNIFSCGKESCVYLMN